MQAIDGKITSDQGKVYPKASGIKVEAHIKTEQILHHFLFVFTLGKDCVGETQYKISRYPIQKTSLLGGVTYHLINPSISPLLANVGHNSTISSSDETTTGLWSFHPTHLSCSTTTFRLLGSSSDTTCWGTQHKLSRYLTQKTSLLGGVTYHLINPSISHLLVNV